MNLLLDAHTLLWYFSGDSNLSANALTVLEDDQNSKRVSAATLWEIAIKVGLGKIQLGQPFERVFPPLLERNRIDLLGITASHLSRLLTLPGIHKDPFDRLLVAQASVESLTIVTRDAEIAKYAVPTLW